FDSWALFSYDFTNEGIVSSIKLGLLIVGFSVVHFSARAFSAKIIARNITANVVIDKNLAGEHREGKLLVGDIKKAFLKNTQPLRSVFRPMPVGWSMRSKRILAQVTADACEFIQGMNDRYTRPSGNKEQLEGVAPAQGAAVETLKPVKSETN
ncbi:MAG: hypothetical protein IMF17_04395, partial [Proteobacteria bacterium]|nr:hypothetical protein [Pseudomonadota bacterium]